MSDEEVLALARKMVPHVEEMTDDQRVRFIGEFTSKWCQECGRVKRDGNCNCTNDE